MPRCLQGMHRCFLKASQCRASHATERDSRCVILAVANKAPYQDRRNHHDTGTLVPHAAYIVSPASRSICESFLFRTSSRETAISVSYSAK